MVTVLSIERVAFWRHDGVVYYVHRSEHVGREPLLVINAVGRGRSQRYAVLSRDECGGEGWQLADDAQRSGFVDALLEQVRRDEAWIPVPPDAQTGHPRVDLRR